MFNIQWVFEVYTLHSEFLCGCQQWIVRSLLDGPFLLPNLQWNHDYMHCMQLNYSLRPWG